MVLFSLVKVTTNQKYNLIRRNIKYFEESKSDSKVLCAIFNLYELLRDWYSPEEMRNLLTKDDGLTEKEKARKLAFHEHAIEMMNRS